MAAQGESGEGSYLLGDALVKPPSDTGDQKSELRSCFDNILPDETAWDRMSSLVTFVCMVVVYFAVGGIYFAESRHWGFTDCMYFSVLTLTTIGYGDLTPKTDEQKVFSIFYVLVGFCILGYALGHIGQYVAKREERLLMRQLKEARDGQEEMLPESFSVMWRVALSAHGVLFFLAIGTLVFSLNENWSVLDALYFSTVSLTTVGYGDLRLHFSSSRCFAIFYLLFGTLMTAFFLGSIAELFVARNQRMRTLHLLYDEVTNRELWRTKSKSGGGNVTESDYMEYMLVASGRVDRHTIQEIKYRYKQLQKSGAVGRLKAATSGD